MRALKATNRLVYEDARYFYLLIQICCITVPLFIIWIILGISFNLTDALASISGPIYFSIPIFAILGFKVNYPIAVGMGATRSVFLKSFYLMSVICTFVALFILNVLQGLLVFVNNIGSANFKAILHPGEIFFSNYNFFSYLFIDILTGIFLFGFTFINYCIFHRLGLLRFAIGAMILFTIVIFMFYGGAMSSFFRYLSTISWEGLDIPLIFAGVGVISLFLSYPLMRHAPTKLKSRN